MQQSFFEKSEFIMTHWLENYNAIFIKKNSLIVYEMFKF